MPNKTCEMRVNIVKTPLNLPLLLSARNRFKKDNSSRVPSYILEKKNYFTKCCNDTQRASETRLEKDLKKSIGIYPPNAERCQKFYVTKLTRDLCDDRPWYLPPNTYGIIKDPFASKRGYLGSYWRKIPGGKVKRDDRGQKAKGDKWQFYNLPSSIERLAGSFHKHRGIFLTNARDRKATARCMINEPATAYHHPNEPSPAHYYPKGHEIAYNISPAKWEEPPNPHIFLRHTSVPDKCLPLIRRHISFEPAVGRYETRLWKHCPCCKKFLTYGLHIIVDREKRRKFRRLPYKKIKLRKLCYPDWDHVVGKGYRHLFRRPASKPVKPTRLAEKDVPPKKLEKTLALYPDSKYINMINTPRRATLSLASPSDKKPKQPIQIRFNCISKRVIRRQLRINKKIVFNSGSERFPELDYRPTLFTATQLEDLKNTLPTERQFRDYPVMRRRLSEIKSQLYETPAHMRPAYQPELRKRFFKFLPLPGPKVLITPQELRSGSISNADQDYFYNKPVSPEKFLKSNLVSAAEVKGDGSEGEDDLATEMKGEAPIADAAG